MSLGFVLNPKSDLGLAEDALNKIDLAWTEDKYVVVLFYDDKVLAMIVHEPRTAATQRGAHIGENIRPVIDKYSDAEEEKNWIRIDRLGLGFDIHKGKVVAITLYPPKTEK